MVSIINVSFVMRSTRTGDDIRELLAGNLRRLRIARHLSLSELARITGASKATLSGIEAGRANPTAETLATIAGALQAPIAELLEAPSQSEVRIVRKAAAPSGPPDRATLRVLEAANLNGTSEISELTLPAHTFHQERARARGSRTHLLILQGKLIAGPTERPSELAGGDYASFPADVPHSFETMRMPARVLLVSCTPV